jgi:AcrR family transcriptional regulator
VGAYRRSTQRERLLDGMRRVAVRDGYARATVAEVIALAGVSRPTVYEYFADKEDCFLHSLAGTHEQLQTEIAAAVHDSPPAQAACVTIKALVTYAASRPDDARLLMDEAMAGSARVLEARDRAVGDIATLIEGAQRGLPADALTPDVPARVLLGTTYRLLARRLRGGEADMTGVHGDLSRWIMSYEQPIAAHRWRSLKPLPPPPQWSILPEAQLREPAPLAGGRRASGMGAQENQRQRILFAAATLAQSNGFAATTIADIAERAGVNRRTFNALFADKQDAFQAVIALGFQRLIAVTARAFFSAATWPERIWEAGRAFTEFFQTSPALAHVGFVETYAAGEDAARQVEDSVDAFTLFLHDGLPPAHNAASASSPIALEAIATSIFETAYLECRRNGASNLSGLLPHVTFLCLAPITGAPQANEFIDSRLNRES